MSVMLRGEGPMRTSGMRYPGHNFIVVHASSRKAALKPGGLFHFHGSDPHYVKKEKEKCIQTQTHSRIHVALKL